MLSKFTLQVREEKGNRKNSPPPTDTYQTLKLKQESTFLTTQLQNSKLESNRKSEAQNSRTKTT